MRPTHTTTAMLVALLACGGCCELPEIEPAPTVPIPAPEDPKPLYLETLKTPPSPAPVHDLALTPAKAHTRAFSKHAQALSEQGAHRVSGSSMLCCGSGQDAAGRFIVPFAALSYPIDHVLGPNVFVAEPQLRRPDALFALDAPDQAPERGLLVCRAEAITESVTPNNLALKVGDRAAEGLTPAMYASLPVVGDEVERVEVTVFHQKDALTLRGCGKSPLCRRAYTHTTMSTDLHTAGTLTLRDARATVRCKHLGAEALQAPLAKALALADHTLKEVSDTPPPCYDTIGRPHRRRVHRAIRAISGAAALVGWAAPEVAHRLTQLRDTLAAHPERCKRGHAAALRAFKPLHTQRFKTQFGQPLSMRVLATTCDATKARALMQHAAQTPRQDVFDGCGVIVEVENAGDREFGLSLYGLDVGAGLTEHERDVPNCTQRRSDRDGKPGDEVAQTFYDCRNPIPLVEVVHHDLMGYEQGPFVYPDLELIMLPQGKTKRDKASDPNAIYDAVLAPGETLRALYHVSRAFETQAAYTLHTPDGTKEVQPGPFQPQKSDSLRIAYEDQSGPMMRLVWE